MYLPLAARASIVAGVLQPLLPDLGNNTVSVQVQAKDASNITDVHRTPFHEAPAFTESISFYHPQASQSFNHMHAHPEVLLPQLGSSSNILTTSSTSTSSDWQATPTTILDENASFWSASESDYQTEAGPGSSRIESTSTPTRVSETSVVTETSDAHSDVRNARKSSAFGAASENPFEDPIFVGTIGMMFFGLRLVGLL